MSSRAADDNNLRITRIYAAAAKVSCFLTFVIGLISLVDWRLKSAGAGQPLQTLSSAIEFMVLGGVLFLNIKGHASRRVERTVQVVLLLFTFFAFLALLQSVKGFDLGLENFLFRAGETASGRTPVLMATATAGIFLLSGLSALSLLFFPSARIVINFLLVGLSAVPFSMGVVMVISYWFGIPLLYQGSTVPVDWTTAFGFLALGVGLHSLSALHIAAPKSGLEFDLHALKRDLPAVITLSTGITLAIVLFTIVHRLEFQAVQNEFNLDTENYSVALEKGIEEDMNELRDLEGFYVSSSHVTRASFRSYADNVLSHHTGIYALQWIPRVAGPSRGFYEREARKEGFPGFRFTQLNPQRQFVTAGKRADYFPVYFTEPYRENELALGLDFGSNPVRKNVLDKARDTGAAVATERIKTTQGGDGEFAFLAFQPIYRNGLPHYLLEDRRRNLTGYVCAVFYIKDLAEAALKGINLEGIKISLVDDSAPPDEAALYSNLKQENSAGSILFFFTTLNIADRTWMAEFYPTDQYLSAHKSAYAWTILGGGICFAILFTLYALSRERHASEIERSNEIINTVLNSIDAAISIVTAKDFKILACNEVFAHASGTTVADLLGKRHHDIIHKLVPPCHGKDQDCLTIAAVKTGRHAVREHLLRGHQGAERHVEISAFPVKNGAGSVIQIVHVVQDITERKQAEHVRLQELQMRRLSAEREAVEARLRMLQAQIEPHFLFNTLANIISLVEDKSSSAKEMLQHFTTYLSQSLQRSRKENSTLAHEAEMLKDYLSIFKMRLGARLEFTIAIPQELHDLAFPPMLLQPLVENAIIHGIEPKAAGGSIAIKAEKSREMLRLTVSDTGLGFSELTNTEGMGLENVKARLQALYHERARLLLEENSPCGTTATIEVPL